MPTRELAGQRLLAVTEEEFQRVVLDIHDGPVQNLFAALSQLALVHARLPIGSSHECESALRRAIALLERALGEIRVTLTAFRDPGFTSMPLADIVEELAVQHETLGGGTVTLDISAPVPDVPPLVKIALYRVLQEALSNIRRHAGVGDAAVRITADDGTLCLEVADNGRGFVPPPLVGPEATEQHAHIGLRGMRERATMLGGTLHVESRPGAGTRVLVRIPVDV
ncbi:MAG: sensor histidine kinase [Gemmatimonadaceae bacterium]